MVAAFGYGIRGRRVFGTGRRSAGDGFPGRAVHGNGGRADSGSFAILCTNCLYFHAGAHIYARDGQHPIA